MNVLIIDDEPLILSTVLNQVNSMGLDINNVDCASNAMEADKFMENINYDIFLCDIVMPGEDGISFAKRVLNVNQDCKFIFLTAHADYHYMKEAIAIQSFDYVLQPVDKDELKRVLENAISQLKIERKNKSLMELGQLFENEQMDILDGNAMRYLTGFTNNANYLRHLVESKVDYAASDLRYAPVLVHVIESNQNWTEAERTLLRSIYYNVVDELTTSLESKNIVILRSDDNGSFILLLCFNQIQKDIDDIKSVLENIRIIFDKSLKTKCAIYYGRMCIFEELREEFAGIIKEQKNNVVRESEVYLVGQLSDLSIDEYSLDSLKNEWLYLLNHSEVNKFRDSVVRFLDYKKNADDLNREMLMRIHQAVSELILSYMVNNNINSKEVFDEEFSYTDFMYCWENCDEFKKAINMVVDKLYAKGDGGDIIVDIEKYIERNINKEILVTEIADYIGLNAEYLTRIFKKEKGVSIKKYIDNKKIMRAKELLEKTDFSVTDISDRVGYSSYNNFSRAFKTHTGVSPTSYRNKN